MTISRSCTIFVDRVCQNSDKGGIRVRRVRGARATYQASSRKAGKNDENLVCLFQGKSPLERVFFRFFCASIQFHRNSWTDFALPIKAGFEARVANFRQSPIDVGLGMIKRFQAANVSIQPS